jgi:hypothetical protein
MGGKSGVDEDCFIIEPIFVTFLDGIHPLWEIHRQSPLPFKPIFPILSSNTTEKLQLSHTAIET